MTDTANSHGAVQVDPNMRNDLRGQSGSMAFVLHGVEATEAAIALAAMQAAVGGVRHPDEPSESLASYLSEVVPTSDGGFFWADISDMEDEDEVLDELIAAAAQAANATLDGGELSARRPD